MTLKQLKEKLNRFPEDFDNKEVEIYSDYTFLIYKLGNVKYHRSSDSIILSSPKKSKARKAKKKSNER